MPKAPITTATLRRKGAASPQHSVSGWSMEPEKLHLPKSRARASAVEYRTQKEVHTAIAKNTLEKKALHQMVCEIYILTCRRINSKWIKDLNCKNRNSSDY